MVPRFRVGMLVWKRSSGLPSPCGVAGVVWVCFWVPGPPPHSLGLWCGSMPIMGSLDVVRTSGDSGGAWWFENWIVDASKGNLVFLFAYRDFAKLFFFEFGFEIDRFVIILSVMICRLAILLSGDPRAGRWPWCRCVACKGVWWMPWQTVPTKDV